MAGADLREAGGVDWGAIETRQRVLIQLSLIAVYGVSFTLLRSISSAWQTGLFFSLWFPAAGLRFAFLWYLGPRFAPAAALSELVFQLALGRPEVADSPILGVLGIVGPCLMYGLAIKWIQARLKDVLPAFGPAPVKFAVAAVTAPIIGCLGALPWALPQATASGLMDVPLLSSALLVFALGDTLGILVIAPPLVWIADNLRGRGFPKVRWNRKIAVEILIVQAATWGLIWSLSRAGFGIIIAPAMIAAGWTGMRIGRVGGWGATVLSAVILLPLSEHQLTDPERVRAHMLLATLAAVGYLSGAFADAQIRAQAEIRRRDRLLYQAERLKTLRGMSLAVIHEISQPLSIIEIEADNLAQLTRSGNADPAELEEVSALVARKARDLSDLVRKLRRFGERSSDVGQGFLLDPVLRDVRRIAEPMALSANIELSFPFMCETIVRGHDIELRQALLNLVNNAIAAAPSGGRVAVRCTGNEEEVRISVINPILTAHSRTGGMGIGLIVARSIVEAHGGRIDVTQLPNDLVEYAIFLPVAGEAYA